MGIADQEAARRDVQVATGAVKPPGAWVHVLTIGINDYDDKAKDLHLDFASKDASDVFNALVNTQDSRFNKLGRLHAEVFGTGPPRRVGNRFDPGKDELIYWHILDLHSAAEKGLTVCGPSNFLQRPRCW
jgi:hypothetical protein